MPEVVAVVQETDASHVALGEKAIGAVVSRGKAFSVPELVVRKWLGAPPKAPDPSTGELGEDPPLS